MLRSLSFLFLSFLSQMGDCIFLSGIPLYLYKESGSLLETSYVTIVITICVFLFKKYIKKSLDKNPLKVTGIGELSMGIVETVFLILFIFLESKYIIMISVFPLAIIYNIYAPSKFLYIQKYFFKSKEFQLTTIQSVVNKTGVFAGVIISGYLVENGGVKLILLADIFTFLIYGISMLIFYRLLDDEVNDDEKKVSSEQESMMDWGSRSKPVYVIALFVFTLIATVEQASMISILSRFLNVGLDYASYIKSIMTFIGLLVGTFLSFKFFKRVFNIWIACFVLILTLSLFLDKVNFIYVILVLIGVIGSLSIPIQKDFYKGLSLSGKDDKKFAANIWVLQSFERLSVAPIMIILEKLNLYELNEISFMFVLVFLVGISYGTGIYCNYFRGRENDI